MVTQATVTLQSLSCLRQASGSIEPYVWPALVAINTESAEVTVMRSLAASSRTVIKSEMRAGEVAVMEYPANTLLGAFDDDLAHYQLILVVALWGKDETPSSAVEAGYQAFLDGLHDAIVSNLLNLKQADDDEQQLKVITDNIKKAVYDKVYSAIENSLSAWEKTGVYLGWLGLDRIMGSDFKHFSTVVTTSFTLSFKGPALPFTGHWHGPHPPRPGIEFEYEIQGNLQVQAVIADPCQAQIDGVKAAQATVDGLNAEIQSLQNQLQHATPQEKSGIIAEITEISQNKIPPAKAVLDSAQHDLEQCRELHKHHIPVKPPVAVSTD